MTQSIPAEPSDNKGSEEALWAIATSIDRLKEASDRQTEMLKPVAAFFQKTADRQTADVAEIKEILKALLPNYLIDETKTDNSKKINKPQGTKINYEEIVSAIYEQYPETKTYDSERLLAYLKDYGRKQHITIDITSSRIRKLTAWKKQRVHRQRGNVRYGYDLKNIPDKPNTE